MSDFNNRISAQRRILSLVNRSVSNGEALAGLSAAAIARWASSNRIDRNAEIVQQLENASEKLLFLANKSQEQVSDEYRLASRQLDTIVESIELALR